jgi:hypothetical protein
MRTANFREKQQVPPLRSPGFPVKSCGFGELHAAFLTESRTCAPWSVLRSRKSGCASVGMTILWWTELCTPIELGRDVRFPLVDKNSSQFPNRIVVPTEAQRSGGTCCFSRKLAVLTHPLQPVRMILQPTRTLGSAGALSPLIRPFGHMFFDRSVAQWRDLQSQLNDSLTFARRNQPYPAWR